LRDKDRSFLFGELATHYVELVRHVARRFGNRNLADDIAQDLQSAPALPDIRNARAYLFRTANNLAIDYMRRDATQARRFPSIDLDDGIAAQTPSPESVLDYKQRYALLEKAVAELPPRCREVFLLHKFDGLDHATIAAQLGISKSMVEKHIIKAMAHCRDRLADHLF
jgi:RNA polymerase sigma-70 factor (ECF subfamily)